MRLQWLMRELSLRGVTTTIHYDSRRDAVYLDLNSRAKSHLHLYESGLLLGRYNYEKLIDLSQDTEAILKDLYDEFFRCKMLRGYGNEEWENLGALLTFL